MKRIILGVMVIALVAGCGKKSPEEPKNNVAGTATQKTDEPTPSPVDKFFESFYSTINNGKTNEAVDMLTAAMNNPELKDGYPSMLRMLIILKIRSDKIQEAKDIMLNAAQNNPEYLKRSFGLICQHYASQNNIDALLDWTKTLMDKKLPEEYQGSIYFWRTDALYNAGKFDDIINLVPAMIASTTEQNAAYIMRRISGRLLKDKKYDEQMKLLEAAEKASSGNVINSFVITAKQSSLLEQGKIEEAESLFKQNAAKMLDPDAATILRSLSTKFSDQQKSDAILLFALENLKNDSRTIKYAATAWVDNAVNAKQYTEAVTRINELMKMDVPVANIYKIYIDKFYKIIAANDKDVIKKILATGTDLSAKCNDRMQQSIRAAQLDGAFLMEDYQKAAEYVRAGIEGHDEAWKKMALNKIAAHQALKDGKIEDAITEFRNFMEDIKNESDKQPERDPTTGIEYSKELILGNNALRIAELYKKIGKDKEASSAYEEAADYYTQALSNAKPDSETYKMIQEQIKKLPAGKGNTK